MSIIETDGQNFNLINGVEEAFFENDNQKLLKHNTRYIKPFSSPGFWAYLFPKVALNWLFTYFEYQNHPLSTSEPVRPQIITFLAECSGVSFGLTSYFHYHAIGTQSISRGIRTNRVKYRLRRSFLFPELALIDYMNRKDYTQEYLNYALDDLRMRSYHSYFIGGDLYHNVRWNMKRRLVEIYYCLKLLKMNNLQILKSKEYDMQTKFFFILEHFPHFVARPLALLSTFKNRKAYKDIKSSNKGRTFGG